VDPAELHERAQHVPLFTPRYTTGVLEKFARLAQGAEKGAVTTR
jgi:dihydroxyacid dehydratase/phosphogluconate dehydratase